MRLTMPRLLLCCSLLLAFGQAAATESRHMDADGAGSTDSTPGGERMEEGEEPGSSAPARRSPQKSKQGASTTPRTSGSRSAPRWHSFLPGMIR